MDEAVAVRKVLDLLGFSIRAFRDLKTAITETFFEEKDSQDLAVNLGFAGA